jgi:hypothetical protein
MTEKTVRYVRKLSGDEANQGYIMVMKESLKLFPKPKINFKMKVNDSLFDSQIKVVDCWCQGPKKPHVHYRIDLNAFRKEFRPKFGQTITVEKIDDETYELK